MNQYQFCPLPVHLTFSWDIWCSFSICISITKNSDDSCCLLSHSYFMTSSLPHFPVFPLKFFRILSSLASSYSFLKQDLLHFISNRAKKSSISSKFKGYSPQIIKRMKRVVLSCLRLLSLWQRKIDFVARTAQGQFLRVIMFLWQQ